MPRPRKGIKIFSKRKEPHFSKKKVCHYLRGKRKAGWKLFVHTTLFTRKRNFWYQNGHKTFRELNLIFTSNVIFSHYILTLYFYTLHSHINFWKNNSPSAKTSSSILWRSSSVYAAVLPAGPWCGPVRTSALHPFVSC